MKLFKLMRYFSVPLFIVSTIHAQDSTASKNGWKYSVLTNLNLSLNSYSNNWAGGEYSAFSWGWQFNGTAEKPLTNWLTTKNTLKLAFGQTSLQQEDSASGKKEWQPMKKSNDLIDFENVENFTLKAFVDPFISFRVITQFSDLRNEEKTLYGNPVTMTESFGALRQIMKKEKLDWSARLGGAVRQNIDRNGPIRVGDKVTNDGGVELTTDLKTSSKDNRISYITQFRMYEALFSSVEDKVKGTTEEDYWRYPDISWENTLGVNLLKYVMLNIYAQLLYDRDVDQDARVRSNVGLALTYSIKN
ncbi:MAG: DUF3078 domain-containing protein [Chitinispirillaceae bacterium]|nr:DUF3078 domain-containing protein [Chitinispirillaceae bacterium]